MQVLLRKSFRITITFFLRCLVRLLSPSFFFSHHPISLYTGPACKWNTGVLYSSSCCCSFYPICPFFFAPSFSGLFCPCNLTENNT